MKKMVSVRFLYAVCIFFAALISHGLAGEPKDLIAIVVKADKKILNPVLNPGDYATLTVTGIRSKGVTIQLPAAVVLFSAQNKLSSGEAPAATIVKNTVLVKEGGITTVTAAYTDGKNNTFTAITNIVVRPYYRSITRAWY